VADTTYIDARFVALENILKGFMLSRALADYPPSQMVLTLSVNLLTTPYVHALYLLNN